LPPKFTDAFDKDQDLAFVGPHSLLCTDQGVRGVLNVTNDLCYVQADELGLANWQLDSLASPDDPEAITEALESLEREPVSSFVDSIAAGLARYDWRTSGAASLSQDEQLDKMALRGSGGYRELRRQLLALLCRGRGKMPAAARDVQQRLGYSDNGS